MGIHVTLGASAPSALGHALLVALLLSFSAHAAAQSDDERARGHFHAGESYFAQGAYADAVREFEAAHRLSGRGLLLLNIATAHERLGDFDAAADSIEQYLASDPDTANAATLRTRRDNLRARAAEVAQRPADGITAPVEAVSASRDGGGGLGPLGITGAAVAGVGLAGAVTALVLTLKASAIHGDLDGLCDPSGACAVTGIQSRIDRGAALSRASTFTWVASGALLATGGALLLVDLLRPARRDQARGTPELVGGPGMAGLGLAWRLQ